MIVRIMKDLSEPEKTKMFAVAGYPILHSKSPDIYNTLFKNSKGLKNFFYLRFAAFDPKEIIETASEIGIVGLNITSPFKETVIPYLKSMEKNAKKIGAVNTLIFRNGSYIGYNTDYIGVRDSFLQNGITLNGKRTVVFGAGGAGTAAAFALIEAGCKVTIINRTFEKAKRLAEKLHCEYALIEQLKDELKNTDIFVSAISSSERIINPAFLKKVTVVLNANYSHSILSKDAGKAGCKVISGLDWLFYQALPAFELFTGKKINKNASVAKKALENSMKTRKSNQQKIKKPNIALIGFMGAGKSTVGKIIANIMNMEFEDVDESIVMQEKMSISEIFEKKGEAAFRKIENKIVKTRIVRTSGKVFSCGGGIILNEENRRLLSANAIVIWFWVSPKIAIERIEKIPNKRPLLEVRDKIKRVKELIKRRIPLYAEIADMVIDAGKHTPKEIAERLVYEINNAF